LYGQILPLTCPRLRKGTRLFVPAHQHWICCKRWLFLKKLCDELAVLVAALFLSVERAKDALVDWQHLNTASVTLKTLDEIFRERPGLTMDQRLHLLNAELADEHLRVGIGAIQGSDEGGAAGGQRSASPPDMESKMRWQCRRHAALALRLRPHLMAGEAMFNEALPYGVHRLSTFNVDSGPPTRDLPFRPHHTIAYRPRQT
jgi:hypothetical protein